MESNGRFTASASEMSGNVARAAERAGNGAHQAIDTTAAAARPAVERLASGAHSAVDSIASMTTQMAASFGRRSQQLREAETRMMDNTRGYVARNPLTALGVAVAAGLLLSRLFTHRD